MRQKRWPAPAPSMAAASWSLRRDVLQPGEQDDHEEAHDLPDAATITAGIAHS